MKASRIGTTLARILLGLAFLVFGLNGFLLFMPPPPSIPGDAGTFSEILFRTHYIWLTCGVQVVAGALLLVNRYVRLALVVLGAVLVNILTFHVTMLPDGLPLALVVSALWFVVAWSHRAWFATLFAASSR